MRSFKVLIRELRGFFDLMADPVLFRTGQRNDEFRPHRLVLPGAGLCTHHSAFVRMFLCALCCDEHFRRRSERPLEQKGRYAGQ